jgi:hypothetical protein
VRSLMMALDNATLTNDQIEEKKKKPEPEV